MNLMASQYSRLPRLQALPRGCRSNDERNKDRNAAEFYLVTEERSNMEGCKIFDAS